MSKYRDLLLGAALVALAAPAAAEPLGIGRAALPEEIAAWDVKIMPDGRGLPPGGMSVEDGEQVFIDNCAACHGDFAEGLDNWPRSRAGAARSPIPARSRRWAPTGPISRRSGTMSTARCPTATRSR
jgi:hypothetical protein